MTAVGQVCPGRSAIRCAAVGERVLLSGDVGWTALDREVPRGFEGMLALNLRIVGRLLDAAQFIGPAALPVLAGLRQAGLEVLVVPDGDRADLGRADAAVPVAVTAIVTAAGCLAGQICYVGVEGDVDVGPAVTAGMRAVLVTPPGPDRPRIGRRPCSPPAHRRGPRAAVTVIADLSELPELLAGPAGGSR